MRHLGFHSILSHSFFLATPSRLDAIVAGLITSADRLQVNHCTLC
ncbi:hypothetical protein DFO77_11390 [Marinilabilia salmonicolor]|uniref:Uncharacterized protein n=1 Tax=Marinilabilia salmonicolor TaxID=989 RepID=A0A368V0X4_9BACT|nr:hypothetical protein DFO77_11390 [Marinilabilia salmonicolor]